MRIEGNELPDGWMVTTKTTMRKPTTCAGCASSQRPTLRPLPTRAHSPGDFPLIRFTPENSGRIQPLPNLSAAAKT